MSSELVTQDRRSSLWIAVTQSLVFNDGSTLAGRGGVLSWVEEWVTEGACLGFLQFHHQPDCGRQLFYFSVSAFGSQCLHRQCQKW